MENKFGAVKKEYNGINFDSTMEADYYQYLLEEKGMKEDEIELQPVFSLLETFKDSEGKTVRGIKYIGDFKVKDVVVDVKGFVTKEFLIKEKLFKKMYPELKLVVITRAPKYSGKKWIIVKELKSLIKERKKKKNEEKSEKPVRDNKKRSNKKCKE